MTTLIIFIIGSFLASILVLSAGILSSRQSPAIIEEYEAAMVQRTGKKFRSRTYPVEINA